MSPNPFPDKDMTKQNEDDKPGAATMMVILETPKEEEDQYPLDTVSTKYVTN